MSTHSGVARALHRARREPDEIDFEADSATVVSRLLETGQIAALGRSCVRCHEWSTLIGVYHPGPPDKDPRDWPEKDGRRCRFIYVVCTRCALDPVTVEDALYRNHQRGAD